MGRGRALGHSRRQRSLQPFSEPELRNMGQRVSAAVHSAIGGSKVVLPADVTIAANGYADIIGLSFPVAAGTLYQFEVYGTFIENVSSSFGVAFAINGPAATWVWYSLDWAVGSQYMHSYYDSYYFSTDYDQPTSAGSSSNGSVPSPFYGCGMILPSADGTVTMRGQTEGGTSGQLVVKRGSYVEAREVV